MRHLSTVLAVVLTTAAAAPAQTLVVDPMGTALTYTSPGANFFDLDVLNPAGVTLQELTVRLMSPVGTIGQLDVWITPSSHVGFERNQVAWTQLASGSVTASPGSSDSCQSAVSLPTPNTYLAPGTYGVAIVYQGVNHSFDAVVNYPSGPYANGDISIDNGTTQAIAWLSVPLTQFLFGGVSYNGTLENFSLTYAVGNVVHACALCVSTGVGSNLHSASAFQFFGPPNPNSSANAALQGKVLSWIPNGLGTGYTMTDNTGGGPVYVDPALFGGAETNLPLLDNQEVHAVTQLSFITQSDNGVTGSTTDFFISSNGYVSLEAAQSPLGDAPRDPQGSLQATSTLFGLHHDLDNSEAGSGMISYYEDVTAQKFYVTYHDVESVPATVVNPCRYQLQFDLATGQVDLVMEVIDAVGGSTVAGGDNYMLVYSPAGVSPPTQAFDFSTLPAGGIELTRPEVLPLTLEAVGPLLINTSFDLVTSNAPLGSIGVNLISLSVLPVPLSLVPLGAPPGTLLYLDPVTTALNTISNTSLALTVPIPNSPTLIGVQVHSQSFWFDLAGAMFPFTNLIGSNLITCTIG